MRMLDGSGEGVACDDLSPIERELHAEFVRKGEELRGRKIESTL